MPTPNRILSWLHISDVHARHGTADDQLDQTAVFADLLDSLRALPPGLDHVDTIFVTGDLATTGGARDGREYTDASAFVRQARELLGIAEDRVFLVPGNHDVDRGIASAHPELMDSLQQLRSGATSVLDRPPSLEARFQARWQGWRGLVAESAPHLSLSEDGGWFFDLQGGGGVPLRLVGLNTALLSQDDEDRGNLRIGRRQAQAAFARDRLVVALGHHPLDWLADPVQSLGPLRRWMHLYLHGHVHVQESYAVLRGGGDMHVTSIAGAVHVDPSECGVLQHAYSFGALTGDGVHSVALRVWPRVYDPELGFIVDARNCIREQNYAELQLPTRSKVALPGPPTVPTLPAAPPTVALGGLGVFRPPLEVYVAWDPASTEAPPIATQLYRWLHGGVDDPLGHTGLGIPVFFRSMPVPGGDAPPAVDFERAEATAIVALMDAAAVGEGGAKFRAYVASLMAECELRGGRRRVVPVALDEGIFRFGGLNAHHFVRVSSSEGVDLIDRVIDGVVHHLARLLRVTPDAPADAAPPPPVEVFLSYARSDGSEVADRLREFLLDGTGVDAFLDRSAMVPAWTFIAQIQARIAGSHAVLVALLTDSYASRETCLRELGIAKLEMRPIVVVDARKGLYLEGLDELAGAPMLRWQGGGPDFWRAFLHTVLLEALRFEFVPAYLRAIEDLWRGRSEGSLHVPRTPAISDALAKYNALLHPDPPLVPERHQLFRNVHATLAIMTPTTLPLLIG